MKILFLVSALFLASCSPSVNSERFNSSEPTLQSAEDANTRQFTEESFK